MALPHAAPGQVIDIPRFGSEPNERITTALFKTDRIEVIRMVIPKGKEIPSHQVPGEITLQCLEGSVALTATGQTQQLRAGQMLYLSGGEQHALRGIEDASLLLTILL